MSRNPERGLQRIDHPALMRQVAQVQRRKLNMTVKFEMEKVTKNTIRFAEVLENELDAPKIGSIYIPKSTLGEIGWKEGDQITIELNK